MAQVILTPVRDFATIRNRSNISGAKLGELKTPTEYTLVGTVEGGNYTAPNNTTHNTWFSLINAANQPVFIATEFVSMQIVDETPETPQPVFIDITTLLPHFTTLQTIESAQMMVDLWRALADAVQVAIDNARAENEAIE